MARRDVSLQYTTGEKTFDWGQLVKEDRGLEWIRLRALLGDADTRRPPFFPLKCSCESRDALEALAVTQTFLPPTTAEISPIARTWLSAAGAVHGGLILRTCT